MSAQGTIPRVKVAPQHDAAAVNAILNHPDVRPWIADAAEGEIDVRPQMENPNVVFLFGEHGGVMLHRFMPGIFEVHTAVEPIGRGPWALGMIRAAQKWLFTKTDCFEVLTRIPQTHKAAMGLAIKAGMVYEFTRPDGVKINGVTMPVDVLSFSLNKWVNQTNELEARGAQFHEWLNEEAGKAGFIHPHEDDPQHNRIVGATLEMIAGGQPMKGVMFYNRWAVISRHAPIALTSYNPLTVRMDIGDIKLAPDGNLEFSPCGKMMH